MPHALALSVEVATTVMAVAGMGYFLAAMFAARAFIAVHRAPLSAFAPSVSILKSLKGVDPEMLDAFRSHCRQQYLGDYELLFGVASMNDPAVEAVLQLRRDFPERAIRLIHCPEQLGTNGKVSTLAQLVPHARHEFLLVNDSDITVGPHYLRHIMASFAQPSRSRPYNPTPVGLVTALYRGRARRSLTSRLEALTIATDFQPGVLLSWLLGGGLQFGLGSTLAVRREALERIGGYTALADFLADDYELGARIFRAGYRVVLAAEVVETSIPNYNTRDFFDHQLRWIRTVRDASPWGAVGLVFTHGFAWALLNVVASGFSPMSLWLLGLSFFLRLGLAMRIGAQVLGDHQVLPNLWLLPVRDIAAMFLWVAGFAGNVIVWRGQRFLVHRGRLTPAE